MQNSKFHYLSVEGTDYKNTRKYVKEQGEKLGLKLDVRTSSHIDPNT